MVKFKCPICNGKKGWNLILGFGGYDDKHIKYKDHWKKCPRCKGEGELDWVSNLRNNRDYDINDSIHYSSISFFTQNETLVLNVDPVCRGIFLTLDNI